MAKQVVRDWAAVSALKQLQKALEERDGGWTWESLAAEINARRVAERRVGADVSRALVHRVATGEVKFSAKLRQALGLPELEKVKPDDPGYVRVDRIVGGYKRECPQCTAKFERGEIEGDPTPDGYQVPPQYIMGNFFRKFCSDACKAEWHAERQAEREKAVTAPVTRFKARAS